MGRAGGPDPYGRLIHVDGSDYADAIWPMDYLRHLAEGIVHDEEWVADTGAFA